MKNKFLLLTKIHFLNNWKFILVWLIAFSGSYLVFDNNIEAGLVHYDARALWWLNLMLYAVIAISFKDYFTKTATMSITLPVKRETKFLVILFQSFVIYPLLILVIYVINHYVMRFILNDTCDFVVPFGVQEWLNTLLYCVIFFVSSVFLGRLAIFYGAGFILLSSWAIWALFAPEGSNYHIVIGRLYDVGYEQLPQVMFLVAGMLYLAWWKFKRLKVK